MRSKAQVFLANTILYLGVLVALPIVMVRALAAGTILLDAWAGNVIRKYWEAIEAMKR